MPAGLISSSAIPLLFGLSSGLVVFGVLSELRRRRIARRVATFVGPSFEIPSGRWRARSPRLRILPHAIAATPSAVQRLLLATVIVALGVGLISGQAMAFALAAVAALVLLALASRTESQAHVERQMPAAVRLIASGLRAGLSVPQTLALVAKESPEPTATEFARTAQEVQLGLSLEEALTRLAERTVSDYALVSTIVSVQHEVGGNLAQTLDAVSETLRERSELRQHAAAITAQQQLSCLVLTALPMVVFLYTMVVSREYLNPLLDSVVGRLLIILAGGLLVVGWIAMRWAGRVDD